MMDSVKFVFIGLACFMIFPCLISAQTVSITTEDHTVSSLTVRVEGTSANINLPMWYEVYDKAGEMIDYGAFAPDNNWFCIVRTLTGGKNKVKVFGASDPTTIVSDSVMLNVDVSGKPDLRPRPNPAQIWWGGTANNRQLKDNPTDWEFVKKYADAFFFHTAAWSTDDETIESLIEQTKPYGGKFVAELGGSVKPMPEWPANQNMQWGTKGYLGKLYQNTGLVLSEVTHDTHTNLEDFAKSYPSLTEQEIVEKFVNYWKQYYELNYEDFPHLKHANTHSPVWWPWRDYRALGGSKRESGYVFELDGREYNFDYFDIMSGLRNMNYQIPGHEHWAFYSDFPYYTMTWPVDQPYDGEHVREKVYAYQDWLHSTGAKHTFVCNEDPTDKCGDDYAWHQKFANNSLESLKLFQKENGRADRYLFESWYSCNDTWMPSRVTPEDQPYTYTWLVKQAIKIVKGIKDTEGSLQELTLSKSTQGDTAIFSLTNKGDIVCLPNLQVVRKDDQVLSPQWLDADNNDINSAIKSDGGWVYSSFLEPGESTVVKCVMENSDVSMYNGISLEAFWNPQDPTGIVRDRISLDAPNSINENVDDPIHIYPNPAYNHLIIEQIKRAPEEVRILDLKGRILIQKSEANIRKTGENKIDISGLKKGAYFIVLNYNNQKITRKFIKQ